MGAGQVMIVMFSTISKGKPGALSSITGSGVTGKEILH